MSVYCNTHRLFCFLGELSPSSSSCTPTPDCCSLTLVSSWSSLSRSSSSSSEGSITSHIRRLWARNGFFPPISINHIVRLMLEHETSTDPDVDIVEMLYELTDATFSGFSRVNLYSMLSLPVSGISNTVVCFRY